MSTKRTKIVVTLGPASVGSETLAALVDAGADVFRLNFSHGERDQHLAAAERVRQLATERGRNLALLQDLHGPKIRIGRFADGAVELERGQTFELVLEQIEGDSERVTLSHPSLRDEIEVGQELLLDDGHIRLRVTAIGSDSIETRVEASGTLSDLKGINVPGVDLDLSALTDKDVADLQLGVEIGVDWVAQSFVRGRDDLKLARHYLERFGSDARLMAKIEKPGAVERFDDILAEADGVMVARGDLGVEMPPEEVPVVQKRLIETTHRAGKPVITATQMLESMIEHSRPTRAEASDVANAIFDGSDAVMLSAETAVGRYPVESVEMMCRIARAVEASEAFEARRRMLRPEAIENTPDAIAKAACEVAETLAAAMLVVFTASGSSAWRIARNRPRIPVLALTPSPRIRAALALAFGVRTELAPVVADADEMVAMALERARTYEMAESGERIVITAGVPFGVAGTTNLVWVERLR
ncbi:MAG: pyruvate kinase [Thermoanaerobaculia bacterium]|nr:pyruvate kinase [Thermoanaerobaculia bacterium]